MEGKAFGSIHGVLVLKGFIIKNLREIYLKHMYNHVQVPLTRVLTIIKYDLPLVNCLSELTYQLLKLQIKPVNRVYLKVKYQPHLQVELAARLPFHRHLIPRSLFHHPYGTYLPHQVMVCLAMWADLLFLITRLFLLCILIRLHPFGALFHLPLLGHRKLPFLDRGSLPHKVLPLILVLNILYFLSLNQ